jgi:hypothetical protein
VVGRDVDIFKGRLDEVRIYKVALPAAWIAAEHANLAQSGAITVGARESR